MESIVARVVLENVDVVEKNKNVDTADAFPTSFALPGRPRFDPHRANLRAWLRVLHFATRAPGSLEDRDARLGATGARLAEGLATLARKQGQHDAARDLLRRVTMGGGDVHWAEYQRAKLHRDPVDRLAAMWCVAKDDAFPPEVGARACARTAETLATASPASFEMDGWDGAPEDGVAAAREWCATRAVSLAPTFARGWRELASWYDDCAEDEKRKGKTLVGGYPYGDDDDDEDVDGGDPNRMSETLAAARAGAAEAHFRYLEMASGDAKASKSVGRARACFASRPSRRRRRPRRRWRPRCARVWTRPRFDPHRGRTSRRDCWRCFDRTPRPFASSRRISSARRRASRLAPSRIASPWNPPRRRRKPRRRAT